MIIDKKLPVILLQTILVLLTITVLAVSCSLPMSGKTGLAVISLPGSQDSSARSIKLPDSLINNMTYTLAFTGPARVRNVTGRAGDTVTVELSPYDLSKGRIIWNKR